MGCVVWKKYALTLVVRKAHTVACVIRIPHAVTLVVWKKYAPDARRLEEICLDTLRLEDIYPDICQSEGTCCGMHCPDATCLTLVDIKKRRRFDNRSLKGYCGDHLCLVHIRTAGTRWERHVHWPAESGTICGGTRR